MEGAEAGLMRAVLKIFFLCLAVALPLVWLAEHPGEARFIWMGFELETGIAPVLGFFAVLFVVLLGLLGLFRRLLSAQGRFLARQRQRKQARAYGQLLTHLAGALEARERGAGAGESLAQWHRAREELALLPPMPEETARLEEILAPEARPGIVPEILPRTASAQSGEKSSDEDEA